jgi:hypothetical protein
LDFARTKLGFTLLIAIPAGLVILEEVFSIVRETQKWYRGRRGRRDGGGGGRAIEEREVLDLRTHLKRVYEKRYAMDEIKVAMYVAPRWYEAKYWTRQFGIGEDAYRTSTTLTVGLVFFSMMFAGHTGGTVSYFQDIESSLANVLRAGVWLPSPPPPIAQEVPPEITPFAALSLEGEEGEVLGESDACDDAASAEETDLLEGGHQPESVGDPADSGTSEPPAELPTEVTADASESPAPRPTTEPAGETPESSEAATEAPLAAE